MATIKDAPPVPAVSTVVDRMAEVSPPVVGNNHHRELNAVDAVSSLVNALMSSQMLLHHHAALHQPQYSLENDGISSGSGSGGVHVLRQQQSSLLCEQQALHVPWLLYFDQLGSSASSTHDVIIEEEEVVQVVVEQPEEQQSMDHHRVIVDQQLDYNCAEETSTCTTMPSGEDTNNDDALSLEYPQSAIASVEEEASSSSGVIAAETTTTTPTPGAIDSHHVDGGEGTTVVAAAAAAATPASAVGRQHQANNSSNLGKTMMISKDKALLDLRFAVERKQGERALEIFRYLVRNSGNFDEDRTGADNDDETEKTKNAAAAPSMMIIEDAELVRRLFLVVSRRQHKNPLGAFEVFRYYEDLMSISSSSKSTQRTEDKEEDEIMKDDDENYDENFYTKDSGVRVDRRVHMYGRCCDCLRHLDPKMHDVYALDRMVHHVVSVVSRMPANDKRHCYPILLSALCEQRSVNMGRKFAGRVYREMTESPELFDDVMAALKPGYWEHLLGLSKFHRQDDIPYAEVLRRAVDMRVRPHPQTAIGILENLFPYANVRDTATALRAIMDLQQRQLERRQERQQQELSQLSQEQQKQKSPVATAAASASALAAVENPAPPRNEKDDYEYVVDSLTLELIGAVAARQGLYDVTLLIWDMVDLMGCQPTTAIYENTVISFVVHPSTYPNAFAVLGEMEQNGVEISRAFIRSISTYLRTNSRNLDAAMEHLKELRKSEGLPISAGALSALVSASAERGDFDRCLALLDAFPPNGLEPDADAYGYCLESLGKNITRRTRNLADDAIVGNLLSQADALLSRMERDGIAPNHHVIHAYVELLCHSDQVDTATAVLLQVMENEGFVDNRSIYRVAMANAAERKFETAKKLAGYTSEPLQFLMQNIRRAEFMPPQRPAPQAKTK